MEFAQFPKNLAYNIKMLSRFSKSTVVLTPDKYATVNHGDTIKVRLPSNERWGAGVETQKNVRGEIGGWGRVPFNEPYAPSLSTIYDGA